MIKVTSNDRLLILSNLRATAQEFQPENSSATMIKSEKISEDDGKTVVENNKRDEDSKATKNDEQESVENNKRDKKEKLKNEKEDGWINPLTFVPITCFYKKSNKGVETITSK